MSTLVLDPVGGIAGDMTIAALLHLGAPRAALDEGLRKLSLPGVSVAVSEVEISGIRAAHVEVRSPPEPHPHRAFRDIRELIARAALPGRAERLSQSAFALLAAAEGRIHGVAPDEVEFHEVGA
ncbi:MAG TPA: nickel insertion protein, partial [Myxococcales bacterium]|nr:nickel insertion protein [Myxococcales bacterium]